MIYVTGYVLKLLGTFKYSLIATKALMRSFNFCDDIKSVFSNDAMEAASWISIIRSSISEIISKKDCEV